MEIDYIMAFVEEKGKDELESVIIRNLKDLRSHADKIRQLDIFLKDGNRPVGVVRFTEKEVEFVKPVPIKALRGPEFLEELRRQLSMLDGNDSGW